MQVIEAQCSWSWRLTITSHIKHERTGSVSMSAMPNESALTIDVPQLRSAVDGLLNAVEDRFGARVSIDADRGPLRARPAARRIGRRSDLR